MLLKFKSGTVFFRGYAEFFFENADNVVSAEVKDAAKLVKAERTGVFPLHPCGDPFCKRIPGGGVPQRGEKLAEFPQFLNMRCVVVGKGEGRSKKKAEQAAAEEAVKRLFPQEYEA